MEACKSEYWRDEISELLQRLSSASEDLSRVFATGHSMHRTSARAILELMLAAEAGQPMTAGALGEALDLAPASVTGLVDRLVAVGHVRREPDPNDRRRVLLVVEPMAAQLGAQFFQPLADDLGALVQHYSEAELTVIRRFMLDATDAVLRHVARNG